MTQQWYIKTAQTTVGPIAPSKLRQLAATGRVTPESLVSPDGENWVRASKVKGLAFAVGNSPPAAAQPRRSGSSTDDTQSSIERPSREAAHAAPRSSYDGLQVDHLHRLYPTPDETDDPDMSGIRGVPARIGVSATAAVLAATAASVAVKGLTLIGVLELDTIALSLAARVAFPAVAFAVTFGLVFWRCGRQVETPAISAELSDEEIARAISNC